MKLWPKYWKGPESITVLRKRPFRLLIDGNFIDTYQTVQRCMVRAQRYADENDFTGICQIRVLNTIYLEFEIMPRADVTINFSTGTPALAYPLGAGASAIASGVSAAEEPTGQRVDITGAQILGVANEVEQAVDWYVSQTGDNSDGLTEATAFRTIAQGLAAMSGGQTLQISAGTYTDDFIDNPPSGSSWNNATTIRAKPGDTVIIDSSVYASGRHGIWFSTRSYIIIDGLTVGGTSAATAKTHNNISIGGTASHIRIQNCEIRYAYVQGINSSSPNGNIEILNNNIHNNGHDPARPGGLHGIYISDGSNILITGNDCHSNRAYGIQIWSSDPAKVEATVTKNRCYDNINNSGMVLKTKNSICANNICWGNVGGINLFVTVNNTKVYHNTVYDNGSLGIYEGSGASGAGVEVRNNISFGHTTNISTPNCTESNNVTSDPTFADAANDDFRLTAASTNCHDAGSTLTLTDVPDDFLGNPRNSPPDIGAYEYP